MKTITIVDKGLSLNDLDSLHNFILAEIKKLTKLESEKIPFVISMVDIQTENCLTLNVQWTVYDAPHMGVLQMMYRKEEPTIMNIVGSKENYLGFIDAAEMLVVHFINLYFSI